MKANLAGMKVAWASKARLESSSSSKHASYTPRSLHTRHAQKKVSGSSTHAYTHTDSHVHETDEKHADPFITSTTDDTEMKSDMRVAWTSRRHESSSKHVLHSHRSHHTRHAHRKISGSSTHAHTHADDDVFETDDKNDVTSISTIKCYRASRS